MSRALVLPPSVVSCCAHFPLCGDVAFDVDVDADEFEALEVAGVCGWKKGWVLLLSPFEGALVTWKGAKRIGGKDMMKVRSDRYACIAIYGNLM